ncbi:uncharacterized protein BXZ73DRAFT_87178 [Epithele typhae]|uniref:uncharacterized protein n=1 Tax=Epithele typhae TaxID=378194 RepID=UPI002008B1CF|nr:uncharacterized protein BXZ73DRAFT_87178 [Epithele typhae]KAH9944239.1 hypothetical protein BXZ73DRAFT_87178 [Epithele typhae]
MDALYAFVTLELHPSPPVSPEVPFQTLCLVTPESVDVSSIKLLRRAFDIVIGVEIIEQEDLTGLKLLGRPDLNLVLTKLHIFRLTQYSKVIFLDADVLPIRPMSHLFTLPHDFAAVPDVGWPDIFNSGVMVFNPGGDKFDQILEGVLNEWRGNDWHRLSFTYNTTPTAVYTYAPAYERFGAQISAIHFIGPNKPWVSVTYRAPGTKYGRLTEKGPNLQLPSYDYDTLVDRWYDIYDRHYRSEQHPQHSNFEFTRYDSAWDSGVSSGPGAALGLDDLRKIAVEGISTYNATSQKRPRVGQYRSMPLNGRVDLMRPRKRVAPTEARDSGGEQNTTPRQPFMVVEGDEVPRMETLPTPLPHEFPPAPYRQPLALPPSAPPAPGHPNEPYAEQQYVAWGQQLHQEAAYLSSEGDIAGVQAGAPPPGMHWASHGDRRFFSQGTVFHPEESEQSEDERPGVPSRQPSWRAQDSLGFLQHSPSATRGTHSPVHQRGTESPAHLRNGYVSPRGNGYQSPRGILSPRGVQSPKGQHSPQVRRSPPPGPPHAAEHPYHPPTHHYVDQQVQHSHSPEEEQGRQSRAWEHPPSHAGHHPQRPSSPPKFEWNPAVEPPPKTPPPSAFPENTYFPNIWDQVPIGNVFPPPPASQIPEQLLREGQYESVIGRPEGQPVGSPPVPDRSKIHAIFPWEEKPRYAPRRVFPDSESAPPVGTFIEEPSPAPKVSFGPLALQQPVRSPPPISLPFNKYASKLLPPPETDEGWQKQDANEGEEEESQEASTRYDSGPRRARAGSSASLACGKGKKYRGRGTRSMGVQVESKDGKPGRGTDMGIRPWPRISTTAGLLPPFRTDPDQMAVAGPGLTQPVHYSGGLPFSGRGSPTGLRSPQTIGPTQTSSPPPLKIAAPRPLPLSKLGSPRGTSSPRHPMSPRRLKLADHRNRPGRPRSLSTPFSPPLERMSSNDTMVTSSPSTTGALETPEGTPLLGPRKSGRVWDPARGVDVFKRSSEEVLARFLRSGSFEEEDAQKRQI